MEVETKAKAIQATEQSSITIGHIVNFGRDQDMDRASTVKTWKFATEVKEGPVDSRASVGGRIRCRLAGNALAGSIPSRQQTPKPAQFLSAHKSGLNVLDLQEGEIDPEKSDTTDTFVQ